MCCSIYPELKDGRVPKGLTNRLGYWKAEELHKFAYPASECVLGKTFTFHFTCKVIKHEICTLGGLLPNDEFNIWILVVRITELVYGPGRGGFT